MRRVWYDGQCDYEHEESEQGMIRFFGWTLEDRGREIVLKNEELLQSIGFAGSHFEKDAKGKRRLKQGLVAIFAQNGVSEEDLPKGVRDL